LLVLPTSAVLPTPVRATRPYTLFPYTTLFRSRSAAGKLGVDEFGRPEVLPGLPVCVLGTVAGGQHDGVALVVPTGESGRAGSAFTGAGSIEQVTGSADQIVSSVCLDLGDPSLHDDVVRAVLLLELLDLRRIDVSLAFDTEVKSTVVETESVDLGNGLRS